MNFDENEKGVYSSFQKSNPGKFLALTPSHAK
jgi:hypothetical protein